MPVLINLRHLDEKTLRLKGELPVEELELGLRDDLIQAPRPLRYEATAELMGDEILVQGALNLPLKCVCVRCLKPFDSRLELDPWTQLLPLEGEEAVSVSGDCVDLTPIMREDILLEFPQHPLCEADCRGLPKTSVGKAKKPVQSELKPSAWAALDKLKLKN